MTLRLSSKEKAIVMSAMLFLRGMEGRQEWYCIFAIPDLNQYHEEIKRQKKQSNYHIELDTSV